MWLCGHIHEGFGYESVRFGDITVSPTLVVNGANANAGRANRLVRGPITLSIPAVRPGASLDGRMPAERRLLAVDLGLRTGLALFDGDGRLLRYAYRRVDDAAELGNLAEGILSGELPLLAAEEAGGLAGDLAGDIALEEVRGITHVAIEGRDAELRLEWQRAAKRAAERLGTAAASVVDVTPEAWRQELLLPKERKNGQQAKATARMVARQVVSDLGAPSTLGGPEGQPPKHAGEFPTDAAEAVCIGYWVARRMGWKAASDRPAVRRYQNGAVQK